MITTSRKNSNLLFVRFSPMIRQVLSCAAGLLLCGCANIDCPLDNQTEMRLHFYDATSKAEMNLSDSLSVWGVRGDSTVLLYNRAYGVSNLKFPLNAAADRDTLLLRFIGTDDVATDTLFVEHSRQPHFESLDCPASMFHVIQKASARANTLPHSSLSVDSVSIANPKVQYQDVDNLKVYLRSAAQ